MSLINEALKRAEAEKSGAPLPRETGSTTDVASRLGLRKPGFPTKRIFTVSVVGLLVALSAWLVMDKFSSSIAAPETPASAYASAVEPHAVPAEPRPDFSNTLTETPAAKPQLKPSDFKLSAIVHGPNGATAIINGQFLQIGSMIQGATIISIARHQVILDADGRRITLQM